MRQGRWRRAGTRRGWGYQALAEKDRVACPIRYLTIDRPTKAELDWNFGKLDCIARSVCNRVNNQCGGKDENLESLGKQDGVARGIDDIGTVIASIFEEKV